MSLLSSMTTEGFLDSLLRRVLFSRFSASGHFSSRGELQRHRTVPSTKTFGSGFQDAKSVCRDSRISHQALVACGRVCVQRFVCVQRCFVLRFCIHRCRLVSPVLIHAFIHRAFSQVCCVKVSRRIYTHAAAQLNVRSCFP